MEEELTKEDILKGIEKYHELKSQDKLNKSREAVTTVLKYEDEEYPVKYIVDLAYLIKTNSENIDNIIHKRYMAINILKNLGFEVINKEDGEDNTSDENMNLKNNQHPLNQILYGPPGTGKTYNTINKALEIIDGEVPVKREDARERFNELREEGQLEFVTFHQSYGYEEFVEGIKADLENDKINYILEDGIFKKLSQKSEKNYLISQNKQKAKKSFEIVFQEQIIDKVILSGILKVDMLRTYFNITDINERTIYFEKSTGNRGHTLSIRTLKKMYEEGGNKFLVGGLSSYYEPILEILLSNSYEDIIEKKLKSYILIIDEINRGNISKIFGELITLIEPSKRIGAEEELKLTLPNSKDLFGVPSNLYIIGTMNTADRSIAQIDTALRRRFVFEEMMPNPKLIEDVDKNPIVIDGIKIQKVLEAINERIEYIYDREHTIGHSYFLPLIKKPTKEKLDEIFKVNILPLLAEYFYGDWEDIQIILNDTKKNYFITKKETSTYVIDEKRKNNEVYTINGSFIEDGYINIYAKAKTVKKDEE